MIDHNKKGFQHFRLCYERLPITKKTSNQKQKFKSIVI